MDLLAGIQIPIRIRKPLRQVEPKGRSLQRDRLSPTFSIHLGVWTLLLFAIFPSATIWAKSFAFDHLGNLFGSPHGPALTMDGDLALINETFLGELGSRGSVIGDNKIVEIFSTEVIESQEPAMFSNAVINDNHFIAYQSGHVGQPTEIRIIFPDTLDTHTTPLTGNDFRLLGMDNAERLLVRGVVDSPGGGQQTALNLYRRNGTLIETVTNAETLGTDILDYDSVFFSRNSGAISFVQRDPGFNGGQSRIMQYLPGISAVGGEVIHTVESTVFLDEPSINMAGQVAFIEGTPGGGPGTGTGEFVGFYNPFAAEPLSIVLAVDDFRFPGGQFARFDEVALNNQGQLFVFGELDFGSGEHRDALAVYDTITDEFDLVIRSEQFVFGFGQVEKLQWDQYGSNELGSMAVTATFDSDPLIDRLLTIVEKGEGSGLHPSDPSIPGPKTFNHAVNGAVGSQPPPGTPPVCIPIGICQSAEIPSINTGHFVGDGPPFWIDPDPAIGFQYEQSEGEPAFASIVVPKQDNMGDGVFTLRFLSDTGEPNEFTIATLERFFFTDFVPGGVAAFTIDGIEFDPSTTTLGQETVLGFVAGLTWTSLPSDQAVITITPRLTVPEPLGSELLGVVMVTGFLSRRSWR